MAIYKKYSELKDKTLKKDDEVLFTLKDHTVLRYSVKREYLNNTGGLNSDIFRKLGLNKNKFCKKHYGYSPKGGNWPQYRIYDYEAATRVVLALYKEINGVSLRMLSEEV